MATDDHDDDDEDNDRDDDDAAVLRDGFLISSQLRLAQRTTATMVVTSFNYV